MKYNYVKGHTTNISKTENKLLINRTTTFMLKNNHSLFDLEGGGEKQ